MPVPRSGRSPRQGLALALAIAAALATTLAACSSGTDDGVGSAAGTAATAREATARAATARAGTARAGTAGALDGSWTLVSGRGPGGVLRLVAGRPVTLTVADRDVGGRAACNSYSGTATRDGGGFAPGTLARTEVACVDDGVMQLESGYLEALAAVTTATAGGDRLVLRGAGVELTFTRRPARPDAAIEGTRWNLDTLVEGGRASTTLGAAFLVFDGSGGVTGNGGCRDLVGSYRLEGDALTLSGLRLVERTDADCGADPRAQDARVMAVLGAPATVEVAGRRLTLTSGSLGLGFAAATGD